MKPQEREEWSVRLRRQFSATGGRPGQLPHSCLDNCMLGLRPRLQTRPSLIDLVTKKDIDRAAALSPVKQDSLSIDLPESPIPDSSTNHKPVNMAPSRDVESQQGE